MKRWKPLKKRPQPPGRLLVWPSKHSEILTNLKHTFSYFWIYLFYSCDVPNWFHSPTVFPDSGAVLACFLQKAVSCYFAGLIYDQILYLAQTPQNKSLYLLDQQGLIRIWYLLYIFIIILLAIPYVWCLNLPLDSSSLYLYHLIILKYFFHPLFTACSIISPSLTCQFFSYIIIS